MLNIAHYLRNANQNYNEKSPHTGQMATIKKKKKQKTKNVDEDMEWRNWNSYAVLVGI